MQQLSVIAFVSSDTKHIFVPRKRRLADRNLSSHLTSVRTGSCTYLDNDLTLILLTSLLHHLDFIKSGTYSNEIQFRAKPLGILLGRLDGKS